MQDSILSQLNKSASGRHAFDLDAEPELIPEEPGDDDGGYDALDDDNDHGGCSVGAAFSCDCCVVSLCVCFVGDLCLISS